ncbi:hypothetical protein CQU01_10860 [Cerasibacillus quisquiliarum]|uniref:Uncharacterized protein n=1 Tax=Cerasibacillus quisquiliarum TaxID=227865 RepID=A0A511UYJ7_9BACI|nr:hypothetical protein CQU01_10860 [Cerasibacillus quisquiliarum]
MMYSFQAWSNPLDRITQQIKKALLYIASLLSFLIQIYLYYTHSYEGNNSN